MAGGGGRARGAAAAVAAPVRRRPAGRASGRSPSAAGRVHTPPVRGTATGRKAAIMAEEQVAADTKLGGVDDVPQ